MRFRAPKTIRFTPFVQEFKSYTLPFLKQDIFAAIAVALMTVPQSIAYSLLAGLPPTAGLYSAIFGAIFSAGFGSSKFLVSGPSTGIAILIQTTLADLLSVHFDSVVGVQREILTMNLLSQIVFLIGIFQIGAGLANVSKVLQFVSRPVVLGYFAGITLAILVTQSFYFLGIHSGYAGPSTILKFWSLVSHLFDAQWPVLLVGIFSFFTLILLKKYLQKLPQALIMLVLAALVSKGLNLMLGEERVVLLGDYDLPEEPIPYMSFPFFDMSILNKIFPSALAIASLAILEVTSISRTFAAKSGQQSQANQDVFGIGIANFILSFVFGSLPASGSTTRTAMNYKLNAKTRFAAIIGGIFTSLIVLFCWPLVQHVPLSALAALLFLTVPAIINLEEIKVCFKATREDAWVFLITFFCCLIFSLDIAFFIGIVISIGSFLKKSAIPHLVEYAFNSKGRLIIVNPKEDTHRKVRIIGIAGELYFAAADVFQSALQHILEDEKTLAIVLRLNNIYHVDASMCLAILRLHDNLKASGRFLLISGLTEEVWHVFHRAGIVTDIGLDNLFFTDETNPQFSTWKAALRAQELIHSY